jgi:hypothetical protein
MAFVAQMSEGRFESFGRSWNRLVAGWTKRFDVCVINIHKTVLIAQETRGPAPKRDVRVGDLDDSSVKALHDKRLEWLLLRELPHCLVKFFRSHFITIADSDNFLIVRPQFSAVI